MPRAPRSAASRRWSSLEVRAIGLSAAGPAKGIRSRHSETPAQLHGEGAFRGRAPNGPSTAGADGPFGAGHSSNASGGGQAHTRLRSPNAPSMRRTGGQYFESRSTPGGNAAVCRS